MKSTTDGVSLSRKELTALLAFASQNEAEKNMWGVHFRIEGDKCFARASNGYAHLELEGINDHGSDGEWMVARKFLVDGQKELESKQVIRLEFKGASLHEGVVLENDVELGRWQSAKDVAISQVSFPWDGVKDGDVTFTVGHDQQTSGIGVIKPLPAKAKGEEDDDGDDEEAA